MPGLPECLGTKGASAIFSYEGLVWKPLQCFFSVKAPIESPIPMVLSFAVPHSRVSSYKAHHGIAGDTLASASHPLWSPCSFARGKKLWKHPHKSFFSICNNPFNLSFLAQHPNSSRNCSGATAENEFHLPRDLVAVLLGFHPLSPLASFLIVLSSHHTKHDYSFISLGEW